MAFPYCFLRLLITIIWGNLETLQCLGTTPRDADLIVSEVCPKGHYF